MEREQQMITISSPLIAGKTISEVEAEYHIHVERVDGEPPNPGRSLKLGTSIDAKGSTKSLKRFREKAIATDAIVKDLMKTYGIDEARAAQYVEEYFRRIDSYRDPDVLKDIAARLGDLL